jgi:hypothetical protein
MSAATPVRPLPPAVRDRIGKLLPMLSSDHDGERAGAVAAIGRVLTGAGYDWHDLTGLLTASPPPPPPRRAPTPEEDTSMAMLDHELVGLIKALRAGRRFTARSEEFLDSLLDRASRFDVVHLSLKACGGRQCGPRCR